MLDGSLVINELMASNSNSLLDGDGNSSDWIELYNPTSSAIDISGWHLSDDVNETTKWAFPDQTVAANEYLVLFASGQATDDYVDSLGYLHTNFKISAAGEYLGLTDANGTLVHEFAPRLPGQTTDISYGLNQVNEPVFFANPTPGSMNDDSSAASTKVSITEIMYHPASNVDAEEYLEIYNAEPTSLDLAGWKLDGAVNFDFPAITLGSGQRLVIAADTTAFGSLYPTVTNVIGGWEGTLSNRSETIRLIDAQGIQVDRVEYADAGDWATRERGPDDRGHEGWIWSDAHDGGGSSLEVVQTDLLNSEGQNWAASTISGGTPGATNSVASSDVAPLIVGVTHQPAIPSSSDNVVVTARLIDESTAGSTATVYFRVDGAPTMSSLAMRDDGLGADVSAGDRLFTALLPAQADGTVVEWYVSASDAAANERTYPSASLPSGLQQTNLLYQVDDDFDPNITLTSEDMREYRLIMTEAERAELEEIGDPSSNSARTNAQMNGTFIAVTETGIDVRYNVGIRNRGNGSRDNLPNNIRVNIPSDRPWKGVDQFNLNTQHTHLQLAGLQLYADSGLPAEDAQAVMVQVNGSNLAESGSPAYGVYIQIEANNGDFTRAHFPDDGNGNLYRGSHELGGDGDLTYLGEDPADYADSYFKKTNEAQNDWSDLIHLTDVLENSSDTDYFQKVQKVVNIDNWLGYFAVIAALGTRETMLGTGAGDDYLIYFGEHDPRAVLIPHDFDAILGTGESTGNPSDSIYLANELPIIERFLTHPDIAPLYHGKLRDLMETTFSKSSFDARIDQLLTEFAPTDEIADLKDFMDARRAYILNEITKPATASSELSTQGGFPTTTALVAGVKGTTPLADSRSVLVNGQLAEFDPFTGDWSYGETEGGRFESIISTPYVWHYLDGGEEPPAPTAGNDWRVDDPGWLDSGPSPLGYGDSKITTDVDYIDTDPDTSGTQKNITTYYRTTFDLVNANEFTSLEVGLQRDDGAIVYLNGTEVARSNMPSGAVTSITRALGPAMETTFFPFSVDPTLLVEGENVLAVELHQVSPTSSDTILDLTLEGTRGNTTSLSGVRLKPGINRVQVQVFDGRNGTGNLVDETYVDIWQNNNRSTSVTGPITSNTTWTAANSPYVVLSDLVISDGTLTIEPGVSVFFDDGVSFTVSGNGQVIAEGTASDRIRFSHNPINGTAQWDGMNFENTMQDNRFVYVDFQSGDGQGKATDISHSRLLLDHVSWFDINDQVIDMVHPTLIVRNSHIPGISGDETIHLVGLDVGEQLVFENNIIGKNTSGGDVVDMAPDSLNRQTIYFTNNTFLGGYDDGVDTDGNIVIFSGNTFRDFHYNTSRTTTSNAISSGHQNVGSTRLSSDLTIRNNTFYDVDHALLLKDFSYALFEHNTVVKATVGGIQLQELAGSNVVGPGLGADLDSNIFDQTSLIFEAAHADTQLTVNRSILPNEVIDFGGTTANAHDLGVGNLAVNPLLANPANGDFRLAEDSPAFFAGRDDSDIGAIQAPRYTAAGADNLQITEIHYHPLSGSQSDPLCEVAADGDWFEFIELYNYSNETVDLSNVTFTDGVDFTFAWGTTVAAGERVVVVKNQDVFESRYGTALPVVGEYSNKLSNSGETLELHAANESVITTITYGDQKAAGWPDAADGNGASLELIEPGPTQTDPSSPTAWRNGSYHGTPGRAGLQLDCDYVDVANGCDIDDLDALYAGANGPLTDALIDEWLDQASSTTNPIKTNPNDVYVIGDTDLDGKVDSADLSRVLQSFKDTTSLGWGEGNLNSDSVVDSADLGRLLRNFSFQSDTADDEDES